MPGTWENTSNIIRFLTQRYRTCPAAEHIATKYLQIGRDPRPAMSSPATEFRYSLVIPAYNEEKRIACIFENLRCFDGEIIVVCDGSDHTADIIETIARDQPALGIRCLRFSNRLGKGGGVIAGLATARAPLVGYVDADGSTSIEEMIRLFGHLASYDVVIGSRWVPGSAPSVRQGWVRRLESRGFNTIIRLLFGLTFHDTQCGAKVFKKKRGRCCITSSYRTGF